MAYLGEIVLWDSQEYKVLVGTLGLLSVSAGAMGVCESNT